MSRIHRTGSPRRRCYLPTLERVEARVVPSFVAPRAFDVGGIPLSVAVGEFNGDGRADLAVGTGTPAESVSVLLGNGNGTFQDARNYYVGGLPYSVAIGDFNGDARQDLVAASDGSTVSLLLGNGDGTFQDARQFYAGQSVDSVAVGDFNGDDRADLVVTSPGGVDDRVSVLLGDGAGNFQDARFFPVAVDPLSVAVGEFNGDGRQDLAVANVNSSNVGVLLGNGDGTFQAARYYPAGDSPRSVAVAEFNGDSRQDLVVSNSVSDAVSVHLGNGDGTFQAARHFPAGSNPYSARVADFNGDGRRDVVVANANWQDATDTVTILLGLGDGTFQAPRSFATGGMPRAVAVAELNGDGRQDLAIANGYGITVSALLGNSDGTFQTVPGFPTGDGPGSVTAGDFNGDSQPDLATADTFGHTVSVLLGAGDGSFQPALAYPAGGYPWSVVKGDFNGDGRQDLVVCNLGGATVTMLLGNGDGTFQTPRSFAAGANPYSVAVGDFNGDGRQDLAVTNVRPRSEYADATVTVLLGNGDGMFQVPRSFAAGGNPLSVAVGDFNHDGRQDLVVANGGTPHYYPENLVSVFLGNGDGSFQAAQDLFGINGPMSVIVADVNRDGRQDFITANEGRSGEPSSVGVFQGNGDGSFQNARYTAIGGNGLPTFVSLGDFNRDGLPDLAVLSGTVRVLLGYGDGRFQTSPVSYVAGASPLSLAVADLSGDNYPDLAVVNNNSDDVSILLNDGSWPGNPVASYYIYSDFTIATAGVPIDLGVFALDAALNQALGYTGEIMFVSTDPLATTPGTYRFRLEDGGLALFGGGVTFRTPGQQALLVLDTATYSVFGFAFFDVQAPFVGGGASGPGLDLFVSEVLTGGSKPARR